MAQSLQAADAAFDQFAGVTTSIAGGGPLVRVDAVAWLQSRETLLASEYRDVLPGFILQCLSIFKFRDFILLYHPDPRERRRFVEQLLEPAAALRRRGLPERRSVASSVCPTPERVQDDTGMREWML